MDEVNMDRDSRMASASGPFKLDEGFAEDSQQHGDQIQNNFVSWLNAQSDRAKADIAYEILRTLRSTDIAEVVERLNPLLHMDPIEKLPPEITAQIFSYLDASTLLTASLSSATWRERILDTRLWQNLYHSQGWGIDLDLVKEFEEAHKDVVRSEFKKARQELRGSFGRKGQPLFKRRATSDWLSSSPRRISAAADVEGWREQHGPIEADTDAPAERGDELKSDVSMHSPQRPNKRSSQDSGDEMDLAPDADTPLDSPYDPSHLLLVDEDGHARLNWPYLYKQRQKLEQNWLAGRFANFQLPHPNHPNEAHTECVYTIQFFGKWLVSGSRDKTLRIWDLDTRRLRGKPLVGHSQSVLCLQFDPTPSQDIIISGSSDSSIIVWKFSTGQKLQTVSSAHDESVLNLRFNHRYLVTCSKDKKIKVWNRNSLLPTDEDYPKMRHSATCKLPSHIIDWTKTDISLVEANIANGTIRALKPFSHLMTFEGHNAAVNAIQIHRNKIVSASGDRLIRVWDMTTGSCVKAVSGHQKGIACVQYDGKRIVSGSSDNTVRIYDPVTATEVATLLGHTNLVRTVQAGFGDLPGSEEEEIAAARAAEKQHQEDIESGRITDDRAYNRRVRNGEYGSSRVTIGSHLPPGGGGGKWARIVSGSYDESIIIWKKDALGNWVIGQTLTQDDTTQANIAVDATGRAEPQAPQHIQARQRRSAANEHTVQGSQATPSNRPRQSRDHIAVSNTAVLGSGNVMSASAIMQAAVNTSLASVQASVQNITNVSRMLGASANTNGMLSRPAVQNAVNQITTQTQAIANTAIHSVLVSGNANIPVDLHAAGSNSTSSSGATPTVTTSRTPQNHMVNRPINPQQPQQPPQNGRPTAAPQQNQHNSHSNSISRVFKLQFDSRRIVCCSQDSRIVGWDFANSDPEIEECSKFFLGP